MTASPEPWHEREYNPRVAFPDATGIYAAWPGRAAASRAKHPPETHRYGDHPRETLDLFRATEPRGALMFIHGGYWRAFSKDDFSWVAEGFLSQGLSVAILNYPLCPDVTLPRICEAAIAGFAALYCSRLSDAERRSVVVAGHSAGGYLAALHGATDWTTYGLPADPIAGIVPISGVFDVEPLLRTSMNDAIRLDAATARTLDLTTRPLRGRAQVAIVVGGEESRGFHRQSERLADHWAPLAPSLMDIAGRNHFDVIDGLIDPGAELNRTIVAMTAG